MPFSTSENADKIGEGKILLNNGSGIKDGGIVHSKENIHRDKQRKGRVKVSISQ